jgi:phosphohistidine phosphatase SixA
MRLYLVQHGDAVPERLNPERPLSALEPDGVHRYAAT